MPPNSLVTATYRSKAHIASPCRRNLLIGWIGFLGLLIFSGCQREADIKVYTVAKQVPYYLPDGWERVENTSAMRLATFRIQGEDSQNAEVAILPMPDLQVGDHEIVNLWRQQLQLDPISEKDVATQSQPVQIGDLQGRQFDLVAPEAAPEEMAGMRIITAFVHAPNGIWFFKLSGENAFLEDQKQAFTDFLSSVDLSSLKESISMMETAASSSPVSPAVASVNKSENLPKWDLPNHWMPTGARSMILASFAAEGDEGKVDITISRFGGGAGGLLPNINRWCQQIGLDAISEEDLPMKTVSINIDGSPATMVFLAGKEKGIAATICSRNGQTWFFKAMGNHKAVKREKPAFEAFAKSIRF